jgi:capsular polysaccharide export protein
MLAGATGLLCAPDDEVRLIASILSVPVYLIDPDEGVPQRSGCPQALLAAALPVNARFADPFGGSPLSLVDIINLCGFWRELIDANRDIRWGAGFAFWKRASVLPLLWNGGDQSAFFFRDPGNATEGAVALWRSKASPELIARLERHCITTIEVEDGFLRSTGLGADCIPPLSITVDRLGPYFDPAQPSELEGMLQRGAFDPILLDRARAVRETIVATGLGKYGRSGAKLERSDTSRRYILVTGQVEDDRSVMTGGCGLTTNEELLERVRAREPDAFLIYKPHPDVDAGHRKGAVSEETCRRLADKVATDEGISALIDIVDEVHVNTSLAGFEALLRQKSVTTYGVPFYAGWGLTRDLGPVPVRRSRVCTLDELVAATLLLYPRYLDPQSGLPCPAEVAIDRLTRATADRAGPLVQLRRFQGRMRARFATWATKASR